ncbi:8305_t:CDS:2 [Racocetra fulgida]|uniref:8305_t:CDS:1 n=1 Tax=Racocetra fulgida TaxID=60492 RepID=A0A9N9DPT6_9GLOM|nr:8305_t:CDS:2 [Racocetra fulgida]
MEHIIIGYYCAGTPYLSPEAIKKIIQSQEIVKNICREMAYKYRFSSIRLEAGFSANKISITDILIKKVDEINDLQARHAQNRKKLNTRQKES